MVHDALMTLYIKWTNFDSLTNALKLVVIHFFEEAVFALIIGTINLPELIEYRQRSMAHI